VKLYPLEKDERVNDWSIISDGKYNLWFARWSDSHSTYIGVDLTPIFPSIRNKVKLRSEPIAHRLLEMPNILEEWSVEKA
jgi:hypothetical protein